MKHYLDFLHALTSKQSKTLHHFTLLNVWPNKFEFGGTSITDYAPEDLSLIPPKSNRDQKTGKPAKVALQTEALRIQVHERVIPEKLQT